MLRRLMLTVLLAGTALTAVRSFAEEAKRPVAPGAQTAPAACAPKTGRTPCESCQENQCCAERRACEADPACAAFVTCLRTSCATPPCNGSCGSPPSAYVARFTCQMSRCNVEACGGPVDGCTLCWSTRCAAATLACLNQVGCEAYAACLADCGGKPSCRAGCPKPTAAAGAAAQAKEACVQKECRAVCGGKG